MLEGGGQYDSWAQTPPRIDQAICVASQFICSKSQPEMTTLNRNRDMFDLNSSCLFTESFYINSTSHNWRALAF